MAVHLVLVAVVLGLGARKVHPVGGDGLVVEALVVPALALQVLDALLEPAEERLQSTSSPTASGR